jgi:hypothetical protein
LNPARVPRPFLALLIFAGLSILWTWPLAAYLPSRIAHDPGDPVLNTWILWWNTQAVPLTSDWWNAPVFHPLPGALALSEHLFGISLFATPMQLSGASPVAAYNISVLLSYALSALFAYLLAFRLTGSVMAGMCAGLAFGFGPYRAGQLGHIQVLTSQWMPAMLLGMHGYVESGQRRWLVLFGASWIVQATANGYYLLFLPALIVPWIAWFTPWRTEPRRAVGLVATWIVCSLPLLPLLLKYHAVHNSLGLSRTLGDIRQYSANISSFTNPPPLLAFWTAREGPAPEGYLFPGLVVVILAAAGLIATGIVVARRRLWHIRPDSELRTDNSELTTSPSPCSPPGRDVSCVVFYASAALLMFWLALGPGGEPDGPVSLLRPYSWLLWLPGYDGLRVPSRFAMPGALCLALAASCSLGWFLRAGRHWRTAIAVVALAGISLDGFMEELPMALPPQRLVLDGAPDAAVLELPADDPQVCVSAMYRARFHGRRVVNGYSGYVPYHYRILSQALWRGDASVLNYLARDRPLIIVVNTRADRGGFLGMIEELPSVSVVSISGPGPVFLLARQPANPPASSGGNTLRGNVRDLGSERIAIDLSTPHTVMAVEFPLRDRYDDFAGRILVEASDDGEHWREVWVGWTGEFALDAALRDPLVAPVRIPLPETRTRYVRVFPASAWMVEEISVVGR